MRPADPDLSPLDAAKSAAARHGAALVEDGMRVGLGTGSTAAFLVAHLGRRVAREGLRLTAVATSSATAALARDAGIDVTELDAMDPRGGASWLDLTIDGADEIDPRMNLIKGGGGALLREKIVAAASDRMVVIADPTKEVAVLGAFPLPVEVARFGWRATRALLIEAIGGMDVLGHEVELRRDGDDPFVTDNGNHILDLLGRRLGDPHSLSLVLNQIPGVVDTGLFVDVCDAVVIGYPDGRTEMRDTAGGGRTASPAPQDDPDNIFASQGDEA